MSGADEGLGRPLLRAGLAILGLMALVDTVNVLTALHDAARHGQALAAWEPVTWEATSGITELIACPIIFAALHAAPPDRRPWALTLLIHGAASLGFSALHVGLMMALRIAIYAGLGFHYRVEAGAAPYEYRKDLLAYLVLAGVIQLFARRRPDAAAPAKPVRAVSRSAPPSTSLRAPARSESVEAKSSRCGPRATMSNSTLRMGAAP